MSTRRQLWVIPTIYGSTKDRYKRPHLSHISTYSAVHLHRCKPAPVEPFGTPILNLLAIGCWILEHMNFCFHSLISIAIVRNTDISLEGKSHSLSQGTHPRPSSTRVKLFNNHVLALPIADWFNQKARRSASRLTSLFLLPESPPFAFC